MPEELKGLIEKIQEEGVRGAEAKARAIEDEANKRAKTILENAKNSQERLMEEAKEKIARMEASGKDSLAQAGRDILLTLRKEINATLNRIATSETQSALNPQELVKMISALVKDREKKDIVISLNKNDLEKLKKGFLHTLKDEIKKGVILKPSEDVRSGLIISYDKGKSHYDFSDRAITEYISLYLKPALAEILEEKSGQSRKKPKK